AGVDLGVAGEDDLGIDDVAEGGVIDAGGVGAGVDGDRFGAGGGNCVVRRAVELEAAQGDVGVEVNASTGAGEGGGVLDAVGGEAAGPVSVGAPGAVHSAGEGGLEDREHLGGAVAAGVKEREWSVQVRGGVGQAGQKLIGEIIP